MTQADSVLSTPPTNTPTRRRFLSTAATLAAGGAALAVSVPQALATESDDPIFAMIERHRELSAHCNSAYDISGKLHEGPEFDAADAISQERHDRVIEQADALIYCEPTTMAGVLAVMRYVAGISSGYAPSDEWETAEGEAIDWNEAFLDTLANAIESIAGGAEIGHLAVDAEGGSDAEV
jgi:hypothetical protein